MIFSDFLKNTIINNDSTKRKTTIRSVFMSISLKLIIYTILSLEMLHEIAVFFGEENISFRRGENILSDQNIDPWKSLRNLLVVPHSKVNGLSGVLYIHRLNMELQLQSLFGLLCTAVLLG